MKAMIFAAGLGTRLRPFTDDTPKALVTLAGKPMLERCIEHLKKHDFNQIIVNVHHHPDQMVSFIDNYQDEEVEISISDERDQLLDTGGGLKKAAWFFDDKKPFLVINADIITDINLSQLYQYHLSQNALATLVVRERQSSRSFLFNTDHRLCGWKNFKSGESKISIDEKDFKAFPFSGIHIIDPKIFSLMREEGKFSIVDVYLRIAKENKIFGFMDDKSAWFDIGDLEKLRKAESYLLSKLSENN